MIKKSKRKNILKNIHALDVYVVFSILALIAYTIISQNIAIKNGIILDTLTTCFFGFFGGEIVTCGLIKIFKLNEIRKENIITNTNSPLTPTNPISNDSGGMGVG